MGDAVAIVSVAMTGAVGLVGTGAAAFAASAQRRWQRREERVVELREVLDAAAVALATTMQEAALLHREVVGLDKLNLPESVGQERVDRARRHLDAAFIAERGIWEISNRLRVRRGSQAPVSLALKSVEHDVGLLVALVGREFAERVTLAYEDAWAKAEALERSFYDAAAAELREAKRS